ncbi:MAG: M20 family metallopeptidase [Desulfovibrio sp.]|nr:M20 family metallopeptidase [Desulfovibrio sp.]
MELTHWKNKLDEWFADKEGEMLGLLETLVNMDSFSHDGADVNRVGEVIAAWMRSIGFEAEVMPKPPLPKDEAWMESLGNVVRAGSHPREAGPGVALIGHMDTVFPAGTAEARPFHLDRASGRVTGPGVLDMKGGLVLNMFVARAFKELGLLDVPLTLTFSADEELGSPTGTRVLADLLNGAHAVLCPEPGYPGGGVSTERKGSGHMLLDIEGKAAHAGRNYEDGASAIIELAHKILAFEKHVDLERGITVNVGLVKGGISANSVAPNATARIHLTFRTLEDGEKLVEAIRKDVAQVSVPGTRSHVSGGIRLYPLTRTPKVEELWELAQASGKALDFPLECVVSKGAAESGFCASVLDLPTLCNLGPEGIGLHSPDEYVTVSTLVPRAKVLALTALQAGHAFTASPKVDLGKWKH